jgi:hypothetical protein
MAPKQVAATGALILGRSLPSLEVVGVAGSSAPPLHHRSASTGILVCFSKRLMRWHITLIVDVSFGA